MPTVAAYEVPEETELRRFLDECSLLGDVGKARENACQPKTTRSVDERSSNRRRDRQAVRAALVMAHGQETKEDIVFRAKIAPQLEMDGEIFTKTGQRHRESKIIAKLAALDLKAWRWHIAQAANNNDRGFFIDLGRILNGEVSGDLCDKTDEALIELWIAHPRLTTPQICIELENQGIEVDEDAIRKRKSRLGLNRKV